MELSFEDASSPGPVSEQHGRLEHPLQAVVLKEGLGGQNPLQPEVVGAPVRKQHVKIKNSLYTFQKSKNI